MHSNERKSKTEAEKAMEKLNREGLFYSILLCEQRREASFLQHVSSIRQWSAMVMPLQT
jgi:hypothetical protein